MVQYCNLGEPERSSQHGDTTVNDAYNLYYTKIKISYHSVETWLTHVLTKNVLRNLREAVLEEDRQRRKVETLEQRDEH